MEVVLFIFYLLLILYFITIIPFFKYAGLPRWVIPALFLAKIGGGFAYAFFYKLPRYAEGSDTYRFYRLSLEEKNWLLHDPVAFFSDIFMHGYDQRGNLFSGQDSYWNDLKSNIPVKLLALMNVITFDSYYTNIILFNFLFLFGLIALYRLVKELSAIPPAWILAILFFLPSTFFWCSGIHKDGLILSATGMLLWTFYKGMKKKFTLSYIVQMAFYFVLIFTLRNFIALAIVPALLGWWLTNRFPKSTWLSWTAIYGLGLILFFAAPQLHPAADFPGFIANKQQEFKALEGGSEVAVAPLEPTLIGFLRYLPKAIDMAFFRPHPTEVSHLSFIPAILENLLLFGLVIFCIVKSRSSTFPRQLIAFLAIGIAVMIIAGYTVTLSGAVVRYRSFALPFILIPWVAYYFSGNNNLPKTHYFF